MTEPHKSKHSNNMSSPQAPSQPPRSRLLLLPPELRNRIWEYAAPSADKVGPAIRTHLHYVPTCGLPDWRRQQRRSVREPAITQVSHQIHNETRGLYYVSNTFAVKHVIKEDMETVGEWLGIVGECAKHIKQVVVSGHMDPDPNGMSVDQCDIKITISLGTGMTGPEVSTNLEVFCVGNKLANHDMRRTSLADRSRELAQRLMEGKGRSWLDAGDWQAVIGGIYGSFHDKKWVGDLRSRWQESVRRKLLEEEEMLW